jgi:hypothetical protein
MTAFIDWQELASPDFVGRRLAIWSHNNSPLCDSAIGALSDLYERLSEAGCVASTDTHTWFSGDEQLGYCTDCSDDYANFDFAFTTYLKPEDPRIGTVHKILVETAYKLQEMGFAMGVGRQGESPPIEDEAVQ